MGGGILQEALAYKLVPAKVRDVAIGQVLDVALCQAKLLVLHYEQRPAAPAIVRVQPQLLQPHVVHHAHLRVDVDLRLHACAV